MFRYLDKIRLNSFWEYINGKQYALKIDLFDQSDIERECIVVFICHSKSRTFDIIRVEFAAVETYEWHELSDGSRYRKAVDISKPDVWENISDSSTFRIKAKIQKYLQEGAEAYGVKNYIRAYHDLEG